MSFKPIFVIKQKTELRKYLDSCNSPYCDNLTKYCNFTKVGEGTFGEVYKAYEKQNKKNIVAVKKVLIKKEIDSFPITSLREINILKNLWVKDEEGNENRHQNIVNLLEICWAKSTAKDSCKSTFYLVFEFCEYDLSKLLSNTNIRFNLGEIKYILQQLLDGLYFIHINNIVHRDIKPANILINSKGILKLADFGLSKDINFKRFKEGNLMTNQVVTLWYRAPELLLGSKQYAQEVDLWALGCVMAELWIRAPLFKGSSEQQQLQKITNLCGDLNSDGWPNIKEMPLYHEIKLPKGPKRNLKTSLKRFVRNEDGLELLDKFLQLDPAKRIDANTALYDEFFWVDPLPCSIERCLFSYEQNIMRPPVKKQRFEENNGYKDKVY